MAKQIATADGSRQKLRLHELAARVAPVQCRLRDEAVAVQDEELPPPAEWGPELEKRRLTFIDLNLAVALREFDSNDMFVAALFLGAPSTSWEFEAWKRCTPDWEKLIGRVRRKRRTEYEGEKRKLIGEGAPSIVARQMADERKQQATEEIQFALRTAMMDLGSMVRASPEIGERRQLDRAEIADAGIDHVHDTLALDGKLWRRVEVECVKDTLPPEAKPPPSASEPRLKLMVRADAWLREEMVQREAIGGDRRRPAMVIALMDAGMTTGKQVPLAEVSRLREQRRKLQAKVALLEAEKQGWLVEKARLISALTGRFLEGNRLRWPLQVSRLIDPHRVSGPVDDLMDELMRALPGWRRRKGPAWRPHCLPLMRPLPAEQSLVIL